MLTIGQIVEEAEWIDEYIKNKEVNEKFIQQPTLQGIVIVKDGLPIGHIPRAHFYQKIGTLYGYNLYMGRANTLLAKTNPLVIDAAISLADASTLAMTLSIAAVSNQFRQYASKDELSDLIAKVKKQCKMQEQNCYILHEEPEMCRK